MFNSFGMPQYQPNAPIYGGMNTVQRIQQQEPIVRCYFVNSKEELDMVRPEYNTIYIGINPTTKEIYTKQLNNNGMVDVFRYAQKSSEVVSENKDIKSIIEKLENIEKRMEAMNSYEPDTNVSKSNNARQNAKYSGNARIQPNDDGKNTPTTNANASEFSTVKGI